MSSLTDKLDKAKKERDALVRPQKIPTGKGDGKWETKHSIVKYRKGRDKAKKLAKKNRRRNK